MYLRVPDEASWRHLVIRAFRELQWEWLSASGNVVPWVPQKIPFESFYILFGSLLGTGVLELRPAEHPVSVLGKSWGIPHLHDQARVPGQLVPILGVQLWGVRGLAMEVLAGERLAMRSGTKCMRCRPCDRWESPHGPCKSCL